MSSKALLEQLLSAGLELADKGQTYVENKLEVPAQGPERDAALSGAGKGAAIAGVLALLLGTRTGRGVTGTGLKLGSLAALGSVAYKAYQNWSQSQATPPETVVSEPSHEALSGPQADLKSLVLLKAIISAAKSDGHIDDAEKAKIENLVAKLGLEASSAELIKEELAKPLDPKAIAALAESPAVAAEIYLVSTLVIDEENEQEKAYLEQLAASLQLPADLALQIKEQVKAPA